MTPLHRAAGPRAGPVAVLLAAELSAGYRVATERLLAGHGTAIALADLAQSFDEDRSDTEQLGGFLAATSYQRRGVAPEPPARRPKPSAQFVRTLLEAARHALRLADEPLFSVLLAESEAEVERARKAGVVTTAEADDWGDRAYLLLGWLARRSGCPEQVQDVLDAFVEPLPLERSLVTQSWVLHFQGMAAADRGDLKTARQLLRRAFDGLPERALALEIELFLDRAELMTRSGRPAKAAELLADTVLQARFFWPPVSVLRLGLRSAELFALSGRAVRARETVDALAPHATPADKPALLATRAEICARAGAFRGARGLFEHLRATESRGSEISIHAALGLARVAAAEGLFEEARGWVGFLGEDLEVLSIENPRRRELEKAVNAIDGEDLPEALADAEAWLSASRDAPALEFRRPFPGAVVLSQREGDFDDVH